jgi:short-subunit dehydrogenase
LIQSNKAKVAVVTGSSKGIGKVIATEFAKSSYNVIINARDEEEELKRAAEDISKSIDGNNRIIPIKGDSTRTSLYINNGRNYKEIWKNRCFNKQCGNRGRSKED